MRRTIVENEMQHVEPLAACTGKYCQQERLELRKTFLEKALRHSRPCGHHQRTEQMQGAHPAIAIGHLHGSVRDRGFCGTHSLAGLDGGLLIEDRKSTRLNSSHLG